MKPSKIYFFSTLLALFLPLFVAAQTNYRPGYYVTGKKDTVTGLIEYRSNSKMKDLIRYKKDAGSQPETLLPINTPAVVVDGTVFMEGREFDDNITGVHSFVFVQRMITGRLSLYKYGSDRFFVSKGDDMRLYEVTKNRKKNRDSNIQTKFQGFGYLKLLTSDCSTYDEALLERQYKNTLTFIDIVTNYNNCIEPNKSQIVHKKLKLKMHFAVGVHGSLTVVNHDFKKNPTLSPAKMGSKLSGTGGVFVSIFHPDLGDQFRVVVEPGIGQYNGYAFFRDVLYANDFYLRYNYLRAPVLARYLHKNLFFDFGWTNFFILSQNNTWRYESQQSVNGAIITTDKVHELKGNLGGIAAGMGVNVKLAGRPVYTSVRFSNLFLSSANKFNQSAQKWFDLNVAIQLTK